MKSYCVRVVGEDALPEGHDWAFLCGATRVVLVVKEVAAGRAGVLEEAWAAYRLMLTGDLMTSVSVPPRALAAVASA